MVSITIEIRRFHLHDLACCCDQGSRFAECTSPLVEPRVQDMVNTGFRRWYGKDVHSTIAIEVRIGYGSIRRTHKCAETTRSITGVEANTILQLGNNIHVPIGGKVYCVVAYHDRFRLCYGQYRCWIGELSRTRRDADKHNGKEGRGPHSTKERKIKDGLA